MSPRSQRHQPRHLAGAPRPPRPSAPAPAPVDDLHLEITDGEVTPVARVQRSRLAFALSITLAAVPLLVVDNLPATADTDRSELAAVVTEAVDDVASSLETTSTTEATTSTTEEATTTSEEPTTTEAPAAVEEPTTTEAPAVQALAAPATTAAPPPPPPPPTTAAPAPPPSSGQPGDPNDPATWDRLAQCESGGNWSINTGNGYYGGLQFSLASWQGVGGSGYPHQHSREEQIHRGQILQARYGWGQWPHCSSALGYR